MAKLILEEKFLPTTPCIRMGDLNTHHPWWSSTTFRPSSTTSLRIESGFVDPNTVIVNWLEQSQFILHNKPGISTFFHRSGKGESVIDLCFSTGYITRKVLTWGLNQDTLSDHALTWLQIDISAKAPPQTRLNWYKADWSLLTNSIIQSMKTITDLPLDLLVQESQALANVNKLLNSIDYAITKSVPTKTGGRHNAPWWDHNLTILKKQAITATRRARTHPNTNNRTFAQNKYANLRLCVKESKAAY